MPNVYSTLSGLFTAIANSIRAKTGSSAQIVADDFPSEIGNIVVATPEDYGEYSDLLTEEYGSNRKLDTPVCSFLSDRANFWGIKWNPVENATSYDIYLDDMFQRNYVITPNDYPTTAITAWQFNDVIYTSAIQGSTIYRRGSRVNFNNSSPYNDFSTNNYQAPANYTDYLNIALYGSNPTSVKYYPEYGGWYYTLYNDSTRYPTDAPFVVFTDVTSSPETIPITWIQNSAVQKGYVQWGSYDISMGNHTVKIIAKADGYSDSDPGSVTFSK